MRTKNIDKREIYNSKKFNYNRMVSIILLFLIVFTQIINFPINIYAASYPHYENDKGGTFKLTASPNPTTAINVGDIITITITVENVEIANLDGLLNYDMEIFEIITSDNAEDYIETISGWNDIYAEYDSEQIYGENIVYIALQNSKGQGNTGEIAKISLKAKKATTTSTKVSLTDIYMALPDSSNTSIPEGKEVEIVVESAQEYDITYNQNTTDTVTGMPSNGTKNENVDYTIGSAPTREGYTFTGWNTAANGSGTNYAAGAIYSTNEDLTLYAQWEKIIVQSTLTVNPNGGVWEGSSVTQTFTQNEQTTKEISNPTTTPNGNIVRFNGNGGQAAILQTTQTTTFNGWTGATLSGTTYTFGTTNETLTANYVGDNITLPQATKTGTTFLGWYDSNQNYVGNAGDTYAPTFTTPNAIITLTAMYQEETYTLTINANGGTYIGSTTIQGTYNSTVTINNPTKTGYIVTLDNNDGTGATSLTQTYIFDGWTSSAGSISGTTYTFGASDATLTANYTPNSVELPLPTKPGYIFKGWYTTSTGGTKIDSPYIPTSDITLYAQWEAEKYTITFNPGPDANLDETTKEIIYNEPYGELPTPTKPGYTFTGWYDENGEKVDKDDIMDKTSDTTLTARWEGNEYQITFDYNGGTGDITNKTIKDGAPYGELPEANKQGYNFLGWYDENGNKVESTDIINTTSDITLKAKYEIKKHFVTFKNDDGTEIKTIKVEHGSSATFTGDLPEKSGVPAGYEAKFTGWDNEQALKNVTGDVTVTATYEISPIVYTITYYNLKNADNSSNPTTYTTEDASFDLVDLQNQERYIFKGWYTSNEDDAEKVTSIDTSKLGNIVLYAQWENDELYLSSEKYKVGENDIDNYEDGDIYLDKIEPNTTVAELINNCDTNGIITVISENGEVLESDDLVGTNMTIKVTKYDEEITLTSVVMGDLSGDGKVTATDLSALNQTILYNRTLEEVIFKAADLDDNRKLTATDLSTVNQAILGIINLTYNKNQAINTGL